MGPRVDFLVRRLTEEGAALLAQLDAVASETWATPVYPAAEAAWTIHSILAHLVSAEGYIRLMMVDIIAGGPGAPPRGRCSRDQRDRGGEPVNLQPGGSHRQAARFPCENRHDGGGLQRRRSRPAGQSSPPERDSAGGFR